MPKLSLAQLARLVGATPPTPPDLPTPPGTPPPSAPPPKDQADPSDPVFTGIATLAEAGPRDISFCSDAAYLPDLASTRAGVVIFARKLRQPDPPPTRLLPVDDADQAVIAVLDHFAPEIARPPPGISPLAHVDPTASLGEGCRIAPFVFIGARSVLGRDCILHPGVVIADDVRLGDQCELFANVVIRERCTLGRRVVIHAGSVIGSDGFGYRWDGARHAKVPQIGVVTIGDDVEIGSCSCVDRAKFSSTAIGPGTKIDNLVQVGHNVRIGAHCIVVGQVGLAGSVSLGSGVVLGGQAAVRDHVSVGDGAMVAACAGVVEDVDAGMVVSGLPALPHRQTLREQAALRRLPELVQQLRKLKEEVESLKPRVPPRH